MCQLYQRSLHEHPQTSCHCFFYLRFCVFPKPEFAFLSVWLGTSGVGQTCHFKQSFGCLHFFLRWRPILATGNFGIYFASGYLLGKSLRKGRVVHKTLIYFTYIVELTQSQIQRPTLIFPNTEVSFASQTITIHYGGIGIIVFTFFAVTEKQSFRAIFRVYAFLPQVALNSGNW